MKVQNEVMVTHNGDYDDVLALTSITVIIIFRSFDTSTLLSRQFMVILEAMWGWSSLSNCMCGWVWWVLV